MYTYRKFVAHLAIVAAIFTFVSLPAHAQTARPSPPMHHPDPLTQPGEYRVETWSDYYRPIPGTPVLVETENTSASMMSDGEGTTALTGLESGSSATITLGEVNFAEGVALGMRVDTEMMSFDASVDSLSLTQRFFQPLLIPVDISSDTFLLYPEGHHTRWEIGWIGGAQGEFDFPAHVGMLLNPPNIVAYERYNQLEFPANDYRLGVVIRANAMQDIEDGFMLKVFCAGHGFSDAPEANALFVGLDRPSLETADFEAEVVHWEHDFAFVHVRGTLGDGDNIILLSPGFGAVASRPMIRAGSSVAEACSATSILSRPPATPAPPPWQASSAARTGTIRPRRSSTAPADRFRSRSRKAFTRRPSPASTPTRRPTRRTGTSTTGTDAVSASRTSSTSCSVSACGPSSRTTTSTTTDLAGSCTPSAIPALEAAA